MLLIILAIFIIAYIFYNEKVDIKHLQIHQAIAFACAAVLFYWGLQQIGYMRESFSPEEVLQEMITKKIPSLTQIPVINNATLGKFGKVLAKSHYSHFNGKAFNSNVSLNFYVNGVPDGFKTAIYYSSLYRGTITVHYQDGSSKTHSIVPKKWIIISFDIQKPIVVAEIPNSSPIPSMIQHATINESNIGTFRNGNIFNSNISPTIDSTTLTGPINTKFWYSSKYPGSITSTHLPIIALNVSQPINTKNISTQVHIKPNALYQIDWDPVTIYQQ
jgi:hypothetical protein